MKTTFLLLLFFIFSFGSITAQHSHQCSHKASFEKSWISDTLDALSYTIHLNEFDFTNQEITAVTEIELTSKINNLDEVNLELMDLTVDEVYVNGIQNTSFIHDGMILSIPLSNSINIGETVDVSVSYHGHPFHEGWGGFHWSEGTYCFNLGVGFVSIPHNLGKTWFPCIDDFQDRAYYTIYATVEAGKDAVCGGLLEEIVDNGNGTFTYKWSLGQPIPTYLASVAVGDYARWTDTYNGMNEDVPIEIWVKPSDSSDVDGSFQNLDAILELFEEKFGPYKFDRVGYVGTAIGAMEHATNIAFPHGSINGGLGSESLLAHELAHMWFGDNVTCSSAEEMWINEGWATFMDALYQEFLYSREQYLDFLRPKHKNVIQSNHTTSYGFFPLNQIPQTMTYDGLAAYDRGALMAHTLRGYLGDDIFFEAMAAFNEEFKYNYASSEDMRDFLTGHTGTDMTGWFDNWVLHSGTPHYSIDSMTVTPTPGETDVTVYLKQKRHGPEFIGDGNKFEITFMDEAWNQNNEMVSFDGQTGSASFSIPMNPVAAFVDLNELMWDAMTDYSRVIKETGQSNFGSCFFKLDVQSISDSVFIRVEHNWAPPDTLKTPVQGLTISPYRYWKIDGIFNDDFMTIGIFMYNKGGHLDDGLITNENDSIVILYRENPADDWQFLDFTQIGTWSIGNLYVEDMQKGEYTIGVCDDSFVGIEKNRTGQNTELKIYPNPSNGKFNIDTNHAGTLMFYDMTGKEVGFFEVDSNTKSFVWDTENLNEGTYFVWYKSPFNQTIAVEKLIVIKD